MLILEHNRLINATQSLSSENLHHWRQYCLKESLRVTKRVYLAPVRAYPPTNLHISRRQRKIKILNQIDVGRLDGSPW